MYSLAISKFPNPGDPTFPLNAVYAKAKDDQELGKNVFMNTIRSYLIFNLFIFL